MKFLTIAVAALGLSTGAVSAATIIDTTVGGTSGRITLGSFSAPNQTEPLGQTFELTQSTNNISVGAFLSDVNTFSSPTFSVTVSIYSGSDFSGPILGSQSFVLADNFDGFQTTDFSSLGTLSAGSYAVGYSSDGNRGAIATGASDFAETQSLDANGPFLPFASSNGRDFAVRATGDAVDSPPAPVPLPAGFPLLAAGLIGLGAFARRKTSI